MFAVVLDKFRRFLSVKSIRRLASASSRWRRQFIPLKPGMKVGLVFDATDPENRDIVMGYKEKLSSRNIEAIVLGFVNKKQFPKDLVFKSGSDFFTRKELQWTGLPARSVMNSFCELDLDLFIAAVTEEELPLISFAAQTRARFRIGPYLPVFTDCFDFMISLKEKKDMRTYLGLVDHYITSLKQ